MKIIGWILVTLGFACLGVLTLAYGEMLHDEGVIFVVNQSARAWKETAIVFVLGVVFLTLGWALTTEPRDQN